MDQATQAAPTIATILTSVGYLLIAAGVAVLVARIGGFFSKM